MERAWLQVGRDYTSGKDRERVTAAIEALEWHPPTAQGSLSPVLMLQAVVTELRLPKVSALGWGGGEANALDYPDGPETATYTVLGVEANYADGRARLYVLDTGVAAVPLASDFPVPPLSGAMNGIRENEAVGVEHVMIRGPELDCGDEALPDHLHRLPTTTRRLIRRPRCARTCPTRRVSASPSPGL